MKFSLKTLIIFVTISALFVAVITYGVNRIRRLEMRAREAAHIANKKNQEVIAAEKRARHQLVEAILAQQETDRVKQQWANILQANIEIEKGSSRSTRILRWNVESDGNDPAVIAQQLNNLGPFDIIGLTEVKNPMIYAASVVGKWPHRYYYLAGESGGSDRMMIFYNRFKFRLMEAVEMQEANGITLNNGRHRAPLMVRFTDMRNAGTLTVILNHLARGDAEFRTQQAEALREWARTNPDPIIAIGDYNFDYDFNTQKGNAGFDAFLKDGVWKWIRPKEMIDTNWSDNGKGGDRYPDSMLDFNFVAGTAKDWEAECRVIVRDGDFPDDETTSDHRPVELILRHKY